MNIETEHGLVNLETNVTNDNLLLTAKIALAHLNEYPNYYDEIEKLGTRKSLKIVSEEIDKFEEKNNPTD